MSPPHLLQPERLLPELPAPVDLADIWLAHALEHLLDACAPVDEAARVDESRLTVVFSALAVEARINRVVREHDPLGWGGTARLTPLEKFQLLPRLLDEAELAQHNELAEMVVELFDLRDALVEVEPEGALPSPGAACTMLAAAARLCRFLDDRDARARRVREIAEGVTRRAVAASVAEPVGDAGDFPPDLIGS